MRDRGERQAIYGKSFEWKPVERQLLLVGMLQADSAEWQVQGGEVLQCSEGYHLKGRKNFHLFLMRFII